MSDDNSLKSLTDDLLAIEFTAGAEDTELGHLRVDAAEVDRALPAKLDLTLGPGPGVVDKGLHRKVLAAVVEVDTDHVLETTWHGYFLL